MPWLCRRLSPWGQVPRPSGKVQAGGRPLVSPIPQGPSPAAAQLPPLQAGPTPPTPTSQVDAHTAPKRGPARLCRAHPHAHAHTGTHLPHACLPTEGEGRRAAGRPGPPASPHPTPHPAVESHGPPPAPITKQHNNRLSEFR
uniref:Uncharacterized protein n=1 Tax=Pipistrellus kuhlii TaxID=59472 RepID=A0A7J7RL09_PIPKU|nr:hypothetical protein mPipKuh1_010525 [Pipistrellus kuhlii]